MAGKEAVQEAATMSKIVCVHGIGQQLKGEDSLLRDWIPAMRDGIRRAGGEPPGPDEVAMSFYGDLFRIAGTKTVGIPPYDVSDVSSDWEKAMLEEWWREAARLEKGVPSPDAMTKLRTPRTVQRALNALSRSRFFSDLVANVFIADLKQVRDYFHNDKVRTAGVRAIDRVVSDRTRVIVAHSLGTVVAYEALAAHPEWSVRMLVTLGSPLGIRNLIFDRLNPTPVESVGIWPAGLSTWVNVVDEGDIVALVKELRPLFGSLVNDRVVHNGATAHDVRPYLTASETGDAIIRGLRA
jgi:pimeloyl-ACP methyl ester carboxylesterase